jgi:tetratricopeptide (TPR) repeat protein
MSRLESEINKPRFEIAKEENVTQPLTAVPLSLRRQTVEQFDREFVLSDAQERERAAVTERNRNPELAEYLANAQLLFRENEFALAQDIFQAVLKIESGNELAIRGAAECAGRLHQHEEAVQILKQLVSRHKNPQNYKLLGDELYHLEYNEDALHAYLLAARGGLVDGEELFSIFKNIGNIQLRLGDTNAAEEYYNKAYTIHPDSDLLLVNFGSLALYKGEYDKALARFREAVTINDKNDKAWVGLAMIHREYGDSELSWANLEKALDINPLNESAVKLVADWAMKDNEIEKAVVRLQAYLAKNSHDALVTMWLAKFLYFYGRLEQAQIEIENALRMEPDLNGAMDVLTVIRTEIQERGARIK